ncbi:TNNT1 isoform 15, partial [Pan troglodytes]
EPVAEPEEERPKPSLPQLGPSTFRSLPGLAATSLDGTSRRWEVAQGGRATHGLCVSVHSAAPWCLL